MRSSIRSASAWRGGQPEVARRKARVGGLARTGASPEQIEAARADLTTEKITDWIERQLASAPPLSGEQLARIRAELPHPAGGDGDE